MGEYEDNYRDEFRRIATHIRTVAGSNEWKVTGWEVHREHHGGFSNRRTLVTEFEIQTPDGSFKIMFTENLSHENR